VVILGRLTADGVAKSAFGGSTITTDRNGDVVSASSSRTKTTSDTIRDSVAVSSGREFGQRPTPWPPAPAPSGAARGSVGTWTSTIGRRREALRRASGHDGSTIVIQLDIFFGGRLPA